MTTDPPYYYLFSISAFAIVVFHIINMAYFKWKKRDVLGNVYRSNNPQYRVLHKYSSVQGLGIAAIILVATLANLLYSIHDTLQVVDKQYAILKISLATMLVGAIVLGVVHSLRVNFGSRELQRSKSSKKGQKYTKKNDQSDDDDW